VTEPRETTPPATRPGASTLEETRPLTTEEWGGGPGGGPPGSGGTGGGGGGSGDGPGPSSNGGPSGAGKRTGKSSRAAVEWGFLIVAALVIAIVIRTFVFQAFYIPSESMVPTLKVGDRVLVNKLSYKLHDPRRGDIVVFKAPEAAATAEIKDLVKRLIGLPGETIEGRDGKIYIDGRELDEPYLPDGVKSRTFGPEKIPPDHYFMLGDNRQYSKDSTFFGPIARKDLIGRAFMRIWPLSHLGFL
jgi:signal peptidase I